MSKKLNPKQLQFCAEYIKDLNATQAAIRAGYSEKTAKSQGQRLLTNADIQAEIKSRQNKRSERVNITADDVVKQLHKQAFADIRDFITWRDELFQIDETDDGRPIYERQRIVQLRPPEEVDGTLITEIKETRDGIQIKRTDPQKALEMLGKHLGMFVERKEISGPNGGAIEVELRGMTTEELQKKARELLGED